MGLHADSVIMTDNLATIVENEIDRAIGNCQNMQTVDEALRHTLAL
jgi:mRNA interferase MazF